MRNRLSAIRTIQKHIKDKGCIPSTAEIMITWNCSNRTAKEYVEAAQASPLEIYENPDDALINKDPKEMSEVEKAKLNIS